MQKYKNNDNSNLNKIKKFIQGKTHKNGFCKTKSLLLKTSLKQFVH